MLHKPVVLILLCALTICTATAQDFQLIFASDPQSFRVSGIDNPIGSKKTFSKETNKEILIGTVKSITSERNISGVIINGDLAESGVVGERDSYLHYVRNPIVNAGLEYYPGLGNHDISNKVRQRGEDGYCPNNECAEFWYDHIKRRITDLGSAIYGSEDIHYAFKKDKYLFVQLNVSPWFKNSFKAGIFDGRTVNIPSPWSFLVEMNRKAQAENLKIILNFHAFGDSSPKYGWNTNTTQFTDFIATSNVVAIFVGHTHEHLGRKFTVGNNRFGQEVDVIYTGAMFLGSYLKAAFYSDKIVVTPVTTITTKTNYYTHAFEDDFSEPFTISFQDAARSQPPLPCKRKYHIYYRGKGPDGLSDEGYEDLPRFMLDFNGDGYSDFGRFVGSRSNPKFSVAYGTSNNNYLPDAYNTITGFDGGHFGQKGIANPWLEDVDGDGLIDYCRYVGSKPNVYLSVCYGEASGFSSRQYQPYNRGLPMRSSSWPIEKLRFGDFDCDGKTDIFIVGTNDGGKWKYSSGGRTAWIELGPSPGVPIEKLRFGDFDGDGKTDVFYSDPGDGNKWKYSSGGKENWQYLGGASAWPVEKLGFGDFDGDGKTDVFLSDRNDGNKWKYSRGGATNWLVLGGASSWPIEKLGFGDFNGDGKTDVFLSDSNDGNKWKYSSGGTTSWKVLGGKSSWPVDKLRFVDIDGDGKTDVFLSDSNDGKKWKHSSGGATSWITLGGASNWPIENLGFGDFDGDGKADVFLSDSNDGNKWKYSSGGKTGWLLK